MNYIVSGFDSTGERDVVFVPVGLNYDRVLEDRVLTATGKGEKRAGILLKVWGFLRFVGRNTSASAVDFDPQKLTSVIGVQRGSAHFAFIKQHFPKMILLSFDSELDVFAGIEAGTIDFGFVDGMRASFWLNQNDCCGFFGGPYFSTEYFGGGLAVAVLPAKGDILRAINIGLRRLGERGKLDELYFKWFAVGFY